MTKDVLGAFRGEPPSGDRRPYKRIITIPSFSKSNFLCIHPFCLFFPMHFLDGRSYPCRPRVNCAGCKATTSTRWEGFIGVATWPALEQVILKIPRAAYRESPTLRKHNQSSELRGMVLECCRFGAGNSKNRPARIIAKRVETKHLVGDFPLDQALCRNFNINSLEELIRSEWDETGVDLNQLDSPDFRLDSQEEDP